MSRRRGLPISAETAAPLPTALPRARVTLAEPRRRALVFLADWLPAQRPRSSARSMRGRAAAASASCRVCGRSSSGSRSSAGEHRVIDALDGIAYATVAVPVVAWCPAVQPAGPPR